MSTTFSFYAAGLIGLIKFLSLLPSLTLTSVHTHNINHFHSDLSHSTKRKEKLANQDTAQREPNSCTNMADQK